MTGQGKNIVISGYYGFDNCGDEAVLAAITMLLKEHLPEANIVALSATPELTAQNYQIQAINRKDVTSIKEALKNARLFISGGGSLFQDITSVRSAFYYAQILKMAQKINLPTIVLAQGLGPLNTWLGKKMTKNAMAKCKYLSWRDQDSLDLAVKIGLPRDKMTLVCDPVLLWNPEAEPTPLPPGKKIAFALRPWAGVDLAEIAKTINSLQLAGHQPILLPFHRNVDEDLAAQLNNQLDHAVISVPYSDPAAIMKTISQVDLLVGMRLHALIMAAAQDIPAIAISYDPKIDSFANSMNIPVAMTAQSINGNKLTDIIESSLNQQAKYPSKQEFQSLWENLLNSIVRLYRNQV